MQKVQASIQELVHISTGFNRILGSIPEITPEVTLEVFPEVFLEVNPEVSPEATLEVSLEVLLEIFPETFPEAFFEVVEEILKETLRFLLLRVVMEITDSLLCTLVRSKAAFGLLGLLKRIHYKISPTYSISLAYAKREGSRIPVLYFPDRGWFRLCGCGGWCKVVFVVGQG